MVNRIWFSNCDYDVAHKTPMVPLNTSIHIHVPTSAFAKTFRLKRQIAISPISICNAHSSPEFKASTLLGPCKEAPCVH